MTINNDLCAYAFQVRRGIPKADDLTDMLEEGYVHFRHMAKETANEEAADVFDDNATSLYNASKKAYELSNLLNELSQKLEDLDSLLEYIQQEYPGFWKKFLK